MLLLRLLDMDEPSDESPRRRPGGLLDFEGFENDSHHGRPVAAPGSGTMSRLATEPEGPHDPLWSIARYGLPRPPFGSMWPVPSLPYPAGTLPSPPYPPVALGNPLSRPTAPWLSVPRKLGNGQTGWQSPFWLGLSKPSPPARPPAVRGLLSLLDEDDGGDALTESTLLRAPAATVHGTSGLFGDTEAFESQGRRPYIGPSNVVQVQATDWQMPMTPGQDTIVDDIEREFRELARHGRSLGFIEMPTDIEHYLGGSGEPRIIHRDRARQLAPIKSAEAANESRQERAFLDKNGFASDLLQLKDGQSIKFDDEFNRDYDNWDFFKQLLDPDTRDFALAFGNTKLKSEGNFAAARVGDDIHIEGTVAHYWNDDYDFHPSRYFGFGGIKAQDAAALEKHGRAKPFARKSSWPRRVKGTIRIVNGELKDPVFEWEDIDQ